MFRVWVIDIKNLEISLPAPNDDVKLYDLQGAKLLVRNFSTNHLLNT